MIDPIDELDPERLYTLPELAQRTGLSIRLLSDAVRAGRLIAFRPGKRWSRVRLADFMAWLNDQRVAPPDDARAWAQGQLERERLGGS